MGKYVTEIERIESPAVGVEGSAPAVVGSGARRGRHVLAISVVVVSAVLLGAAIAGYAYWTFLKTTPQYSLAMLVDAAKRDDATVVAEIVDTDAVVDDFVPQITAKAVELYGRGISPEVIQRIARIAQPVMPALKSRARDELPTAIRQKTAGFAGVPFAAMVLGAGRYLDIKVEGETALVRSLVPEHNFEVKMRRTESGWKIVSVADEELATRIAQRVGQEIIAIAVNGTGSSKSRLGIRNINELLREAEDLFK